MSPHKPVSENARIWEEIHKARDWGKYPGEDLIRFVMRGWKNAPNRRAVQALEIGCGQGCNLWFLAREGFTVSGIDAAPSAVAKAKARLDEEVPGWQGELRVGDMGVLPFLDRHFDLLIDNEATFCVPFDEAQRIFAEMARVAKPGARLFCRTLAPSDYGAGERIGHNGFIFSTGPFAGKGYVRVTDMEEIPTLLRGFTVEGIDELSWTLNNRTMAVREWIITARLAVPR